MYYHAGFIVKTEELVTLKIDAAYLSQTFFPMYQNTQSQILEDTYTPVTFLRELHCFSFKNPQVMHIFFHMTVKISFD
jgi:hypothetical protein